MTDRLFRLKSKTFCAGFLVRDDVIIRTAPILKWLKGKKLWQATLHAQAYDEELLELK